MSTSRNRSPHGRLGSLQKDGCAAKCQCSPSCSACTSFRGSTNWCAYTRSGVLLGPAKAGPKKEERFKKRGSPILSRREDVASMERRTLWGHNEKFFGNIATSISYSYSSLLGNWSVSRYTGTLILRQYQSRGTQRRLPPKYFNDHFRRRYQRCFKSTATTF